jgi:hypothetical protein
MDSPVAFDRDLARLRLDLNRLIAAVGLANEAIMAVAKARGFTLRLDPAPDHEVASGNGGGGASDPLRR